jgi:hypothetical protein
MKSFLLVTLCLALPAQALANHIPPWGDVVNNPKYVKMPTQSQVEAFASHAIPAAPGPQIFTVADRFVFLFDQDGRAVVTFDLTQDHIGIADMIMGSIGIGHWSIEGIYKLFRNLKEKPKDLLDGKTNRLTNMNAIEGLDNPSDFTANDVIPQTADEIAKGTEKFAEVEFNDDFVARHGADKVAPGERSGYKPTSFTLGDLYIKAEHRAKAEAFFNRLALVLFKKELKDFGGLENFAKQWRMDWDQDKQQFKTVWAAKATGQAPEIPGWVINYTNPTDTLAYKVELQQIMQDVSYLDVIFGVYGAIAECLVTRTVDSIENQLDSHENQMLEFFEGAAAGVYQLGMPLQNASAFVDGSELLLYLSKLEGSDDLTNAQAKRQNILKAEAANEQANLAWLTKHGYEAKVWADGRSATAYTKKGKRVGIVSLAIDPAWLTKWQSWHYYDAVPVAKTAGRLGLELFVEAVRLYLPSQIDLSSILSNLLHINIQFGLYIPGEFWDGLFRGRSFTEIGYEGFAISQVNATLAGKWQIPGYSAKELEKVRTWLYAQRINPYEVTAGGEAKAMARNMKLIQDFIGRSQHFDFQLRDNRLN